MKEKKRKLEKDRLEEKKLKERLIGKCLIASDIDKTLVDQNYNRSEERGKFLDDICPTLIHLASKGVKIALITGNSMKELTTRFLRWILEYLYNNNKLCVLSNFHFFTNSGAVYTYFPIDKDPNLKKYCIKDKKDLDFDEMLQTFIKDIDTKPTVQPKFIDSTYIDNTSISNDDSNALEELLNKLTREYNSVFRSKKEIYRKDYQFWEDHGIYSNKGKDVSDFYREYDECGKPIEALLEKRCLEFPEKSIVVQYTIKPILSFRFAKPKKDKKLFGNDVRTKLIRKINKELHSNGLSQYIARPGGRSSIDVSLEKIEKSYPLNFIINKLNVQGSPQKGLPYGFNTIYFGDEVIAGQGNDYTVTKIPGVMVFAVNEDRNLVPLLSKVLVPSQNDSGPEATHAILLKLQTIIQKYRPSSLHPERTPVDSLRREIFIERIKNKINDRKVISEMSTDNLSILHTFTTLLARSDVLLDQWLMMLCNEFDEIMINVSKHSSSGKPNHSSLGNSNDESSL